MTSQHEDTAVDQIDFGSLSDAELADIADNDSRTTAQDKAKAEQNRRSEGDGGSGTSSSSDDPRLSPSVAQQVRPTDAGGQADYLGLNREGVEHSAGDDAGQKQLQDAQDKIDQKGFIGGVPDPTPNENYAAENSTTENDLPTPETDAELFNEARKASLGNPLENVERNSVETATGGDQ